MIAFRMKKLRRLQNAVSHFVCNTYDLITVSYLKLFEK